MKQGLTLFRVYPRNRFHICYETHRTVVAYENYVRYLNTGCVMMEMGNRRESGDACRHDRRLAHAWNPYEVAKLCVHAMEWQETWLPQRNLKYSVMASDAIEAVPLVLKQ